MCWRDGGWVELGAGTHGQLPLGLYLMLSVGDFVSMALWLLSDAWVS